MASVRSSLRSRWTSYRAGTSRSPASVQTRCGCAIPLSSNRTTVGKLNSFSRTRMADVEPADAPGRRPPSSSATRRASRRKARTARISCSVSVESNPSWSWPGASVPVLRPSWARCSSRRAIYSDRWSLPDSASRPANHPPCRFWSQPTAVQDFNRERMVVPLAESTISA